MGKIEGTAAGKADPAAEPAAAGPQAPGNDAAHRFSHLLSGRRPGAQEHRQQPDDGSAEGAPAGAGAALQATAGRKIGDPAAPGGPHAAPPLRHAALSKPGPVTHRGPAGAPPPGAAGRLPGPAERLFGPQSTAEGLPHAGGIARPHDGAEDAERLAEGGALAGLAAAPAAAQGHQPLGPLGASQAAAPDTDLASQLADRILVAAPRPGETEVRIRLNLDTLQGAEITLRRDAGGLQVAFDTPSPAVADRLAGAREGLVERLREKTGEPVTVEIRSPQDSAAGDRRDGRSRNRFDYDAESGDDA